MLRTALMKRMTMKETVRAAFTIQALAALPVAARRPLDTGHINGPCSGARA
jgi:hypothetical protein